MRLRGIIASPCADASGRYRRLYLPGFLDRTSTRVGVGTFCTRAFAACPLVSEAIENGPGGGGGGPPVPMPASPPCCSPAVIRPFSDDVGAPLLSISVVSG